VRVFFKVEIVKRARFSMITNYNTSPPSTLVAKLLIESIKIDNRFRPDLGDINTLHLPKV
jgi:hypothetical protein